MPWKTIAARQLSLEVKRCSKARDFAQTNTCGSSVAAKGKCTISVTFTPRATGTRTSTLKLNDGANNSPQTVSLTGTGKNSARV
jgi:uncharacterized NAD-dependent epimerase/dehydratase family protein